MRITIESTNTLTEIEGVQVRVWHGTTERGVPCIVFIHRLAVDKAEDAGQFEAELREMPPPRILPLSDVFSLRQVL